MNREKLDFPFNPVAILDNLRMERYPVEATSRLRSLLSSDVVRSIYYSLRSGLPDPLRRALQRIYLNDFKAIAFPRWPVDTTVEQIHERLLLLAMKSRNLTSIPFIWFWPNGATASAIVTHDVETTAGLNFVPQLMEIDASFGIRASYQIVPEKRYQVPSSILEAIRMQHCEVNVQGLDHEGNLFKNRDAFHRDCHRINQYVHDFQADGFRSPCMYRNPEWLEEIDVSYDMSIPNGAHMEPQRGGCCTVFPYFIGRILELPLTMIQDYSLFRMLGEYSIDLWKSQMDQVMSAHGLISFIVHPDYILKMKPKAVYRELLNRLTELRSKAGVWTALPGEVNQWWRQRSEMKLSFNNGFWQVVGKGRESARVAFARIQDDRVTYSVAPGYQAGSM